MNNRVTKRFVWLVLFVVSTLLIGTLGFSWLEGYSLFDAFYMSLITMTTIGYKEVNDLSRIGRIFNSFFIIFSVTMTFFAIGLMTQTIVEMELGEFFGKRRAKRMIEKMQQHFIVCGYGRVGRRASEELQKEGAAFVVVDHDPERVEAAMRAGMLAVAADSTRDRTLLEVGVERAKGLIAALATDADNLFVVLSSKTLNPRLTIAARAAEEEAAEKLRRAGAEIVFAPYSNAGEHLARSILRPHVTQFLDFTTRGMGIDAGLEQVLVESRSACASKSLEELQLRQHLGIIVLAIRRANGSMAFNPPADSRISEGDYLIVMGEQKSLRQLERMLAEGRA